MRRLPSFLPALLLLGLGACVRTAPAGPRRLPAPVRQAGEPDAAASAEGVAVAAAFLEGRRIAVPVAGITPSRLRDTFTEDRDGGQRQHNALDILAPRGTPVLAADDGTVLRLRTNRLGGITIYATDPEHRLVYYYAHLEGYREGLREGQRIARGDTIGFVGTTGNAPKDTPHLHFQVMRMPRDPNAYWNGEPINPYPVLAGAAAAQERVSGPR